LGIHGNAAGPAQSATRTPPARPFWPHRVAVGPMSAALADRA